MRQGEGIANSRLRRKRRAKRSTRYTLERLPDELLEGFLDPREQKVLRLRLGLEDGRLYTQTEIALELNIGKERVRQIESAALWRLAGKGAER
jgi:DNA-directed RNA polymerase sigma subunit (sigma70/sigma32)